MCGIAGIMTRDGGPPDDRQLDALTDALAHRGPDGRGRRVRDGVGLVHTRLAIIDLETGAQPILGPEDSAIVANGEIYNYLELREQLSEVRFTTRSDSELPLWLYHQRQEDFVEDLRGMYALALHDVQRRRLVLARDPFGIKPLYYAETAHGLAFASEAQALIAAGWVSPNLNQAARNRFLFLQFSTGAETLFTGIQRVLPGETLIVEGGRVVARRHRAALPAGAPQPLSDKAALERLEAALSDSVTVHRRADVPYGLFLSGGVDSASVLRLMSEAGQPPVRTFTVGFPDAAIHDERSQAEAVARAVGAKHSEIPFREADFWRLLPQVAEALDDPCADYAILPTYRLAEQAGQELKVVLSGEGGDEMLAGYGRYRRALRPRWLGGRAMRARGVFDGLDVLRRETAPDLSDLVAAQSQSTAAGHNRLQALQAVDCAHWLPNDLLIKLDRCLMAHGVEGRTPLLDPVVSAATFSLPDALKVRQRTGKWLLRRWLENRLPEAHPFAHKRGFSVPVGQWIGRRAADLAPRLASHPAIMEIAEPDAVRRLVAETARTGKETRQGFAVWLLLLYALWWRRHLEGGTLDGDVLELLA